MQKIDVSFRFQILIWILYMNVIVSLVLPLRAYEYFRNLFLLFVQSLLLSSRSAVSVVDTQ